MGVDKSQTPALRLGLECVLFELMPPSEPDPEDVDLDSALIWAIILGFVVFDEWPDNLTLVGMAVIVITGIYMFRRERIVAKLKV